MATEPCSQSPIVYSIFFTFARVYRTILSACNSSPNRFVGSEFELTHLPDIKWANNKDVQAVILE